MATFPTDQSDGHVYPHELNPWPSLPLRWGNIDPHRWLPLEELAAASVGAVDVARAIRGTREMVSLGLAEGCSRTTATG